MPTNPETYASSIPARFRGLYQRAISGSRSAACKAMCLECQGWSEGAVKAVRECPSRACPNWTVRPFQKRETVTTDETHTSTTEPATIDPIRLAKIEALKKAREARRLKRLTDETPRGEGE